MVVTESLTEHIEETLETILHSDPFRNSSQLQALLSYLVRESLAEDSIIKERVIGIEVFGRSPDYDTANDPIVRSRVVQVRKRLASFYAGSDALDAKVRIQIPNGHYRCEFLAIETAPAGFSSHEGRNDAAPVADEAKIGPLIAIDNAVDQAEEESALVVPVTHSPTGSSHQRKYRLAGWAIAAVFLIGVSWFVFRPQPDRDLRHFWAPVLAPGRQVVIYLGTIPLFIPQGEGSPPVSGPDLPAVMSAPETDIHGGDNPGVRWIYTQQGASPASDIEASLRIANLLGVMQRKVNARSTNELPFVDLQNSPVVLVGAYDNYWTLKLAKDLPFFFDRVERIHERDGARRTWTSVARADNTIVEDYAIVFRLAASEDHGPVIGVAGLTSCGTRAAAAIVTDPERIRLLMPKSSASLSTGNYEVVLHTSLQNCVPTTIKVVAVHE
jgi:hypothetical protein